jgi:coenzyme PQQ biosynthesis protein B
MAVSAHGERSVLLNTSPDLRQPLAARPPLWPRSPWMTPLEAVMLTDGEIDHTLGLLALREGPAPLPVYASPGVAALLRDAWPLFRVLAGYAGRSPSACVSKPRARSACSPIFPPRAPSMPPYARAVAALEFKCDVLWTLLDKVQAGPPPWTPA